MQGPEDEVVEQELETRRGADFPRRMNAEWGPRRVDNMRQVAGQNPEFSPSYKTEFPTFDYTQPRQWILRCENFLCFLMRQRHEIMNLLYVNLTGKVGLWYEGYVRGLRGEFH